MRPKLPEDRRRSSTLEIWAEPSEFEDFRHLAMRRGFRRRVAGSSPAVYRGDLSRLVHHLLQESASDQKAWRRLVPKLQAAHEPLKRGDLQKFQMRVRSVWLERIRRLAADAGFIHGNRGNVSGFLRALLRHEVHRRDT